MGINVLILRPIVAIRGESRCYNKVSPSGDDRIRPGRETCRAFYPLVKTIVNSSFGQVRLVVRHAPLHQGSDTAVKILEAAKLQGQYWPAVERALAGQPHQLRLAGQQLGALAVRRHPERGDGPGVRRDLHARADAHPDPAPAGAVGRQVV